MITAQTLLELCRELLNVRQSDYVAAAGEQIRRLIPNDDVCWVQCDWGSQAFVVWRTSTSGRDAAAEVIMPATYENPVVQSYVRRPSDLSPRRLSDEPLRNVSELDALRLSQQYLGQQQVSVIMNVRGRTVGRGWIIGRDGTDFNDDELGTAMRLLPVLFLLDQFHSPKLSVDAGPAGQLTDRERQVINLVRTGLTAHAIGHALGISQRTVSKHLQNAYDKLGIHDRLLLASGHQGVKPEAT